MKVTQFSANEFVIFMEQFFDFLTVLGIGSLFGIFFQSYLDRKNKVGLSQFKLKESRYKATIILMWTKLNPKKELKHLRYYRNDISNLMVLEREIKLELYNSLLFAGDNVIKALKNFIKEPNHKNYSVTVLEMRKDLYNNNTKIVFKDVEVQL